ncbi:DUF3024 domain-containing protein [Corynebacterium glucuronolyticum]|uniref:DUF3024 domain-containing protein n=1 Tax=Corynebacterium glucuronolyticum TaxID=39791 RepID=UPI00191D4DFA|nr:DUF3024 domain-containing protein [Corynebacterium glucuronolyticum]MCT1443270.1 DUF3024 domain-containing protein [Corynebacterium glucuronolyticum]QQU88473.1 DUF3024 domain-containing protein [Corynebacterium glucuronolyticum]
MALPELDVARIKRWCDAKIPEHLWDQLKIEVDVASHHATIVEVRPSWRGEGGADSLPVARLRYTQSTGPWSLYWRDRNLKFHQYDFEPTPRVQDLLDYISTSQDPIFFV